MDILSPNFGKSGDVSGVKMYIDKDRHQLDVLGYYTKSSEVATPQYRKILDDPISLNGEHGDIIDIQQYSSKHYLNNIITDNNSCVNLVITLQFIDTSRRIKPVSFNYKTTTSGQFKNVIPCNDGQIIGRLTATNGNTTYECMENTHTPNDNMSAILVFMLFIVVGGILVFLSEITTLLKTFNMYTNPDIDIRI